MQHDFVYLAKSTSEKRIIENGDVFSFTLDEDDMEVLDNLTTAPDAYDTFYALYKKCIVRDTDIVLASDPIVTRM